MTKTKYNLDLLKTIIIRDICKIDLELYTKLNRNISIDFICFCGESSSKIFYNIYAKSGAFCQKCTKLNTLNKRKATNIIKYGYESAMQNTEIIEKVKATNMEKYGCENVSQSEIIREKVKATNLDRYGYENVYQVKEIRDKVKETNVERYGYENVMQNINIREKVKATNMEKYGCENVSQSKEIRDKVKATNLERYGYEYGLQSKEVKDKTKVTNIERYGYENVFQVKEIRDKAKATNMEKYGCENVSQSEVIREKVKATNLERYGYEHHMQNAEIFEKFCKNAYKLKLFTFPCKTVIQCQGYEPFALDILVKKGYKYEDIITEKIKVPKIWYQKGGKKHRYFCDIFIPTENRIIEVKSIWTYEIGMEEDIPLKGKACINSNYKFEVWIFDRKGNIEILFF